MTSKQDTRDMEALVERIETAEGPSSELDAEIQVRVFEKPDYRFPDQVLNRTPASWWEATVRFRWDGGGGYHPWPNYTASLDAAMTLVPEGWRVSNFGENAGDHVGWFCWLMRVGKMDVVGAPGNVTYPGAATPALALCAAALRARSEHGQDDTASGSREYE